MPSTQGSAHIGEAQTSVHGHELPFKLETTLLTIFAFVLHLHFAISLYPLLF